VIDLDLPVTGDLDDPQFRIGPIVWKVFVNLLTKAVTAPFALLGSLFGGGEEVNLIAFPAGDAAVAPAEGGKLANLAKALTERPGLELTVPAVFNRDVDVAVLQEAGLHERLVAARKAELAARRKPVEGVDYAAISADPGEHLRLLTALHRELAGPDAPLPEPPPDAADPAARIGLIEAELRGRVPVTDAEFFALATARAGNVQAKLLTDTGIDPARVFLTSPAEGKAADGGVVMELALR